ncbi:MAG: AAA family ATPase, partial [Rhodospirillaceae bacterium]
MRLLVIRGRNLASLADPFIIDLTKPPLAGVGLFAITGPTGAGKSTILDAVCLALFNRIPRLPTAGGVLFGREDEPEELRALTTDVRGILTRGAASGYAEVEFEGGDGVRYRARWEVRRARERAAGRLQNITQSLTGLDDGKRYGGTITEVREEIERRLGLSFDQFRRAVMLAQGDFAAFLKAQSRDRSELLEQITGTEIYSRLSIAAYHRGIESENRLREIQARRDAQAVLDPAERDALEFTCLNAQNRETAAGKAVAIAQHAQLWHRQMAKLSADADAADRLQETARAALVKAEPERRQAVELRQVLPLRHQLATGDRTAAEAAEAETLAVKAALALANAEIQAATATDRASAAESLLAQAHEAWAAAEPGLERASILDGTITRESADHQAAEREHALALANETAARTARNTIASDLAAAATTLAVHQAWLADQAALAPVAIQWQRWSGALDRAGLAEAALKDSTGQLTELTVRIKKLETEEPGLNKARLQTEAEMVASRLALTELRARPVPMQEQLRAQRLSLERQREVVRELQKLADETMRTAAALEAALRDAAAQRSLATDESNRAGLVEAERLLTTAELKKAEAASMRLWLAQRDDVVELRAHLTPGAPCPVCGGKDHPWFGSGQAVPVGVTDNQKEQVGELRRRCEQLDRCHGGHVAAATAAIRRAEQLDGQCAEYDLANQNSALAWSTVISSGLPAAPWDATVPGLLAGQLAELDQALDVISSQEQEAIVHQRALAQIGESYQNAVATARTAADNIAEHHRQISALVSDAGLATAEGGRAELASELALTELDDPFAGFGDWRALRIADAVGFRHRFAELAAAWRREQQAMDAAGHRHGELTATLRLQNVRLEQSTESLAATALRFSDVALRLTTFRSERAGLLEGRQVALVRRELLEQRRNADKERTRAGELRLDKGANLAAAQQAGTAATAEAGRRREAALTAAAELDRELAALGLNLADARQRLSGDPCRLDALEKWLAALERAADQAATRLEERHRLAAEHLAQDDAPVGTSQDAETALAAAELELNAARNELAELSARVNSDDLARQARTALEQELQDRGSDFEVWDALRTVIGAHDGKKFRVFAQSLSLDQLLGHANLLLAELTRRYRLERVAGGNLELQVVDCDMADEIRSVHSLSGGETFLISLALALGLSSMTGIGARIGTLFIDEGFGALDPVSL